MKYYHKASHVKVYVHSVIVFNICQTKRMISRWYARQECKLISLNNFINTQCCKCSISFVYSKITTPRYTTLLYTPTTVKFLLLVLRGLTVFNCGSGNVTFFFLLKIDSVRIWFIQFWYASYISLSSKKHDPARTDKSTAKHLPVFQTCTLYAFSLCTTEDTGLQ